MSHFCGIVFGHEDNLDKILERYYEGISVDPYIRMPAAEALEWAQKQLGTDKDPSAYKDYIREYWEDVDAEGNVLSTYNPESKWDWWEIGGGWDSTILKPSSNQATIEECTQIDTPFCFIDLEGNWHEKAKMHWWAITSDEKEQDIWDKEFKDYLNSVPKDTLLTVIDFHI